MPRYLAKRSRAELPEATDDWWAGDKPDAPFVSDHQPVDTGLLDASGNTIWRLPNPIGFGRDEEW